VPPGIPGPGYVIDRRQGNTGGRGGLLGPLYAIGKGFPFPEAQPYDAWGSNFWVDFKDGEMLGSWLVYWVSWMGDWCFFLFIRVHLCLFEVC